jgi:hypothetical protein
MNRIVIEFSPEDRQRLDEIIGFLGLLVGEWKSQQNANYSGPRMTQAEDGTVKLVPPAHPADASTAHLEPPAPAPAPVAAAPAPAPVPLGEFQKALVTRCAESADVKQKVQALVHRYADSVSAIPEDKRPEVLAALAEI